MIRIDKICWPKNTQCFRTHPWSLKLEGPSSSLSSDSSTAWVLPGPWVHAAMNSRSSEQDQGVNPVHLGGCHPSHLAWDWAMVSHLKMWGSTASLRNRNLVCEGFYLWHGTSHYIQESDLQNQHRLHFDALTSTVTRAFPVTLWGTSGDLAFPRTLQTDFCRQGQWEIGLEEAPMIAWNSSNLMRSEPCHCINSPMIHSRCTWNDMKWSSL